MPLFGLHLCWLVFKQCRPDSKACYKWPDFHFCRTDPKGSLPGMGPCWYTGDSLKRGTGLSTLAEAVIPGDPVASFWFSSFLVFKQCPPDSKACWIWPDPPFGRTDPKGSLPGMSPCWSTVDSLKRGTGLSTLAEAVILPWGSCQLLLVFIFAGVQTMSSK